MISSCFSRDNRPFISSKRWRSNPAMCIFFLTIYPPVLVTSFATFSEDSHHCYRIIDKKTISTYMINDNGTLWFFLPPAGVQALKRRGVDWVFFQFAKENVRKKTLKFVLPTRGFVLSRTVVCILCTFQRISWTEALINWHKIGMMEQNVIEKWCQPEYPPSSLATTGRECRHFFAPSEAYMSVCTGPESRRKFVVNLFDIWFSVRSEI